MTSVSAIGIAVKFYDEKSTVKSDLNERLNE